MVRLCSPQVFRQPEKGFLRAALFSIRHVFYKSPATARTVPPAGGELGEANRAAAKETFVVRLMIDI